MRPNRGLLKKILYILIILAAAPFALEVVLLADIAGAEFVALFLFYYLKTTAYAISERWLEFRRGVQDTCALLAELPAVAAFDVSQPGLPSLTLIKP